MLQEKQWLLEHPSLADTDTNPTTATKTWQRKNLKEDQVHSSDVEKSDAIANVKYAPMSMYMCI